MNPRKHMNKQDLARVLGLPGNLSELIESESLATIARTANSLSHDLRHYLSVMYANAELMTDASIPQSERDELFREVRSAVHGITDLLDSLLLFTRTGRAVYPEYESITLVIQRSFEKVGSHPRARDIRSLTGRSSLNRVAHLLDLLAWICRA